MSNNERVITVKRCGICHCPYCHPHSYATTKNFCHHPGLDYENEFISSTIKTFPRKCPLKKKEDENND